MKGLLVLAGQSFRKTHDLDELAEAVLPHYPDLASHLDGCRQFTRWGLAGRYPTLEDDALASPSGNEIAIVVKAVEVFLGAVAPLVR